MAKVRFRSVRSLLSRLISGRLKMLEVFLLEDDARLVLSQPLQGGPKLPFFPYLPPDGFLTFCLPLWGCLHFQEGPWKTGDQNRPGIHLKALVKSLEQWTGSDPPTRLRILTAGSSGRVEPARLFQAPAFQTRFGRSN